MKLLGSINQSLHNTEHKAPSIEDEDINLFHRDPSHKLDIWGFWAQLILFIEIEDINVALTFCMMLWYRINRENKG